MTVNHIDSDGNDWSGGAMDAAPAPPALPLLPQLGHERRSYRTDQMTRAQWLVARAAGKTIGASHVAGIMQRHPFSTPIQVATTIRGLGREAFGPEEIFRMEVGTVCEPQIRRLAAVALDAQIVRPETRLPRFMAPWPQVLQHPTIDCLTCNLDGIVGIDNELFTLECKWTSWRNRAAWKALAERHDIGEAIGTSVLAYYIQMQTQLAITGLKRGFLIGIVGEDAALRMLMNAIQGRDGDDSFVPKDYDIVVVTVARDEDMIRDIEHVVPRFYKRFIVDEKIPPLTNPERDLQALRDAHRVANPLPPIPKMPELDDIARRYRGIVHELSKGEKLKKQRQAEMLHAMTEASVDTVETGGHRITYKPRKDGARVFRVAAVNDPDE